LYRDARNDNKTFLVNVHWALEHESLAVESYKKKLRSEGRSEEKLFLIFYKVLLAKYQSTISKLLAFLSASALIVLGAGTIT
jgi:hypothetical protein